MIDTLLYVFQAMHILQPTWKSNIVDQQLNEFALLATMSDASALQTLQSSGGSGHFDWTPTDGMREKRTFHSVFAVHGGCK